MSILSDVLTEEEFDMWVNSLRPDQRCASTLYCPISWYLFKRGIGAQVSYTLVHHNGMVVVLPEVLKVLRRLVDNFSEHLWSDGWDAITSEHLKGLWNQAKESVHGKS